MSNNPYKELLLKDLCGRIPYHPKGLVVNACTGAECEEWLTCATFTMFTSVTNNCRLYLRSMDSMTDEEKEELLNLLFDKEAKYFYIDEKGVIDGKTSDLMKEGLNYPTFCPVNIELYTDWLNSRHFDYRGLIEKGLAIEAPVGMYNIKEK